MNILFSPWSEYCIYQGEEDEWPRVPDLAVQFSPGNPVLCRGDLGICLAAWYWINFSKNSISRADHIMYLRKTRTVSHFSRKSSEFYCMQNYYASPVPVDGHVTLYIRRKLYDKSFLLKHFYYKAHLQSLICSQQRNHRRNIFPYKFQIAWDWHLDAIMPAASCLYDK